MATQPTQPTQPTQRRRTLPPTPADPERHDNKVGASQPDASTWDWENAYAGPPEDGQPRAGSAGKKDPEPPPPAEGNEEGT
jgi:hypothetical protein